MFFILVLVEKRINTFLVLSLLLKQAVWKPNVTLQLLQSYHFLVYLMVLEKDDRAPPATQALHFIHWTVFKVKEEQIRRNKALSVSERKHRKLQCLFAWLSKKRAHERDRKRWKLVIMWELACACVDVSCVGTRALMKWPVKHIKGGPFTLLLKQLCSEPLCCRSCLLCQIHECTQHCWRMFFLVWQLGFADGFFSNFPITKWSILSSSLTENHFNMKPAVAFSACTFVINYLVFESWSKNYVVLTIKPRGFVLSGKLRISEEQTAIFLSGGRCLTHIRVLNCSLMQYFSSVTRSRHECWWRKNIVSQLFLTPCAFNTKHS